MATVVHVDSIDDEGVVEYVGLTDVALRRRVESAQGLFVAEGDKVIRRALAAGFTARSMLMARRWVESLSDILDALDVTVYVAADDVLADITGFNVHRGALAVMNRRPLLTVDQLLRPAQRLLVLEGVVDHTNVGAAFRSAAALGVDAVLIDPRCADPLYRRSVKVSMGSVFSVPWTRASAWPEPLRTARESGFELWALTPEPAAVDLDEAVRVLPERLALVVGTEGSGLSEHALGLADRRVRIPMAHGIDSLNVAAATAVACYATRPVGSAQPRNLMV